MTRQTRLRLLRWSYAAFIAYASAETFLAPQHGDHHGMAIQALALAEFLAAIVFASGFLDAWAGTALLIVYAIAGVITVVEQELPLRFLYYAATAFYVMEEAGELARQKSKP